MNWPAFFGTLLGFAALIFFVAAFIFLQAMLTAKIGSARTERIMGIGVLLFVVLMLSLSAGWFL